MKTEIKERLLALIDEVERDLDGTTAVARAELNKEEMASYHDRLYYTLQKIRAIREHLLSVTTS